MRRAVIVEQLAGLLAAADQEIPVRFQLAHVGAVAEAGRAQQLVPAVGPTAVDPPGRADQSDQDEERHRAGNLPDAEDAFQPPRRRIGGPSRPEAAILVILENTSGTGWLLLT
ncbi:hypothetical protein, partial [Sphingomonas sp. 179-A 4D3 NHS]|uniref:hypothetical protein n=1 Tax=Sphingomonas sp. 179-A 4D3 NHS TaxID=3374291 RepID=UPI00387A82A8